MGAWDIFCKVVDNFGDVGFCWRLARQLAEEHAADVRLWIDHLPSFARLCPAVAADADVQCVGPIEVRCWRPDFPDVEPADVVIEGFGCDLPASYIAAMARRTVQPAWIILDYLSAEDWVEDCHRQPSLRTNGPLIKYFFYPGFTPRTGGLLCERHLLADRAAFDAAAEAAFWQSVGVPGRRAADELRVSLFCYQNPCLSGLLKCFSESPERITLLVTPGMPAEQVAAWFGSPLKAGEPLHRGSLTSYALPYLPHAGFDRLLWACDVNFIRGEDSFVRAQWAGRPFVWQIYPQSEDVHLVKLDAFLGRYLDGFAAAATVTRLWRAWNGGTDLAAAWPEFVARRTALCQHAESWAIRLDEMGNLADNLACFVRDICCIGLDASASGQIRDFEMSIVTAGELNSGNVVMVESTPFVVMKKSITRSGRNAAICKLRLRNLMTGGNSETVVKAEDKMDRVTLEKKECTYSYYSPPSQVFVDSEYNQYEIDEEMVADLVKYLIPDMQDICEVTFFEGRPISVELPKVIVREVEYTEPAARGDTSGKILKPARLKHTKHELQVTAFVEIGDMIEIDTTTDEFRRRC